MVSATFSYEGINIGVSLERGSDLEWLEEFLLPWFALSGETPDVVVRVDHDLAAFNRLFAAGPAGGSVKAFMMDTRLIVFARWNAPDGQFAFCDTRHRIVFLLADNHIQLVCAEYSSHVRKTVMRVLRELAMGVAQLRGGRFLHAASFEINGQAAIITGPRQAGKTSLVSYLLTNSGGRFLGNDRVLVRPQGESFCLRGMPTIVSVRDGTMDLVPGMRTSIERQRFTSGATLAEIRQGGAFSSEPTKEGRRGLSSRQFCVLLDCEPVSSARAAIVLLPRQTGRPGGIRTTRLDAAQARERLKDCLFGHIGPDRLSEAFTYRPPERERKSAPDDETLCSGLAEHLQAFDCELGNDAYASPVGANQLIQLLDKAV